MTGAHVVSAGETLSGIAAQYGLALVDVARWNDIADPDRIAVGQKIELSGHQPPTQSGDIEYTVVPGDTVSGLAERFGKRWIDIAAANQLDNIDHIEVGQKLVIPAQGVAR